MSSFCQGVAENLNVPPRARWIATWRVRVALVLELQMKAKPVHPLEHFILTGMNCHGLLASDANLLLGAQIRCDVR